MSMGNIRGVSSTGKILCLGVALVMPRASNAQWEGLGSVLRLDVGTSPRAIAEADFDGDGKLDLATANWGSDNVSVLLNTRTGTDAVTFAPAAQHAVLPRPYAIVAADFDDAGGPDIITNSESRPNQLSILWNGPQTDKADFAAMVTLEEGTHWITALAVGDADNDGDLDVALASTDFDQVDLVHKVRLLTYRGGQTFEQYWSSYVVEAGTVGVALADVGGDESLDLVTVNSLANSVSVLLNKGDDRAGEYHAAVHYSLGTPQDPSFVPPRSLAVVDVDGDHDLDLLVEGDTVFVLKNNGDGTFGTASRSPTGGKSASALAVADFDLDGAIDVVGTVAASHELSVLFNYGDGEFWPLSYASAGVGPVAVTTADIDGDGFADIAPANGGTDIFDANLNVGSDDVSVLFNARRGRFAAPTTQAGVFFNTALEVADLDGDGDEDLITLGPFHHEMAVVENQGGGALCSATLHDLEHLGPGTYFKPVGVAAGNVDGDADLDLVGTNSGFQEVAVLLSDSGGGYDPVVHYDVGAGGPDAVALADLSGGGDPVDLVTANRVSESVSILVNDGTGAFGMATVLAGHGAPVAVLVEDLDGENGPDIITANGGELLEQCNDCVGTPDLSIFWNQGGDVADAGNWTREELSVEGPPTSVAAADLDGDAYLDLVSASPEGGSVSILLGDGAGNFTRTDIQPGDAFFPSAVATGDLDGNDTLDIVAANRETHDVSVFLQQAEGTFSARLDFGVGAEPAALAVTDMDGDGDADVVTANRGGGNLSILSNREEEHRFRFVVLADSRSNKGDCDAWVDDDGVIHDADTCINKTPLTEVVRKIREIQDGAAAEDKIKFAVFTGDMIYGFKSCDASEGWNDTDGSALNDTARCIEAQFGAWKEVFDTGLPSVPIYPVFGSHERDKDGGLSAFNDFFDPDAVLADDTLSYYSFYASADCVDNLAGPGVPSYGDTVYRFDYENATFFVLNNDVDPHVPSGSEHHRIGPCQQEWIARELPSAKPLTFFFHHEPAYGVLSHGATNPNCDDGPCTMDANKPERNAYIELIADEATLLFSGHEHHFTVRKIDEDFAEDPINGSPAMDFGRTLYEVKTGSCGAQWKTGTATGYTESLLAEKIGFDGSTPPWTHVLTDAPFHFALVDVYDASVEVTVYAIAKDGPTWARHVLANFVHPPTSCNSPLATPIRVDADRDGALDSEEEEYFLNPRTVRMATATGEGAAFIDVPAGLRLANAENYLDSSVEFDQTTKPAGHFPFGVHQFDVSGLEVGEEIEVVLEFPADVPADLAYWYHDARDGWSELPIGGHDGDRVITLALMDGGVVVDEEGGDEGDEPEVIDAVGDSDGFANGVIRHQGGLVDFSYVPPVYPALFVRGDANADEDFDLSDAVYTLNHLFLGFAAPPCEKAADTNDDGFVDITDVVYSLDFLFRGGPPPFPPRRTCGTDETADALSCESYPPCD